MFADSAAHMLSRREFFRGLGVGMAGVGAASAWAAPPVRQAAAQPQVVFRYSGPLAASDPSSQAMLVFKEKVEKGSKGRIRVDVFDGGKLGGVVEVLEQVRSGAITLSHASASFLQSVSPSLLVVTFPYLFQERAQAFTVLDGAIGQRLAADAERAGLKLLGWHDLGLRHVVNKKRPVTTLADMRGLKLRVQPNPVHLAAFRAFGANPVAMDFKELYSAIQQGVVDGIEYPLVTALSQRFYEVTKYISLTGHVHELMVTHMNKAAFDRLPAELQRIVVDAGTEEVAFQRKTLQEREKRALEELRDKGMVINQLPKEQLQQFVQQSRSVYGQFEDRVGKDLLAEVLKITGAAKG